jgi:transketolase
MRKLIIDTAEHPGPIYIRLGKGGDKILTNEYDDIKAGKGVVRIEPVDGLFITTGVMTQVAYGACAKLKKLGYQCGLIHLHTVKPLDGDLIKNWVPRVKAVITVEENVRIGGFGSAILEYINDELPVQAVKITRLGISDAFANEYGNQESLLSCWGLEEDTLVNQMVLKLKMRC